MFGFKNVMSRGISKIFTFVIRLTASKLFGKTNTEALVEKTQVMTKQIQILQRRLECISADLK